MFLKIVEGFKCVWIEKENPVLNRRQQRYSNNTYTFFLVRVIDNRNNNVWTGRKSIGMARAYFYTINSEQLMCVYYYRFIYLLFFFTSNNCVVKHVFIFTRFAECIIVLYCKSDVVQTSNPYNVHVFMWSFQFGDRVIIMYDKSNLINMLFTGYRHSK